MKSILGLAAGLIVATLFGFTYWLSVRQSASWLDGQWLFMAALPYNWTLLHVWGSTDFSPDSVSSVALAWAFDVVAAFLAGALVETIARRIWRFAFRPRRPASG
jgi:hypothetical protein